MVRALGGFVWFVGYLGGCTFRLELDLLACGAFGVVLEVDFRLRGYF